MPDLEADQATLPGESSTPRPHDKPYQALYRRYRPQRFSEVQGQEHVTRALLNSVRTGRVAHAYLFSGPRGTGKTSTARILAMALNCEAPADGEPDGTCPSCLAIRSGASMDVFELDAASNRKLDEMRELLSRVALGTPGRWKVYIVDEVHQLTPDAASALLKTLEEPPPHVVFVLATTDPQKVLPTILSRTQHFEFRLFSANALTALLEEVNEKAGLHLPAEVVQMAARRGRGSARDALSALDQLASAGVKDGPGYSVSELVDALGERDVGATLQAVARAISAGTDPRRLGNELVEHLRNAFLALQAPNLVQLPGTATSELAEQASRLGLPLLVRAMEAVGEALINMRDSADPRVTLEVALIRCASPGADASPGALLERLERLEKLVLQSGPAVRAPAPPTTARPVSSQAGPQQVPAPGSLQARSGPAEARKALGAFLRGKPDSTQALGQPEGQATGTANKPTHHAPEAPPAIATASSPAPEAPPVATKAGNPDRDQLTKAWGDFVLAKLSKSARAYLAHGRFAKDANGDVVLALPDRALVQRASNFLSEAQEALSAHFGCPVPLKLAVDSDVAPTGPTAQEGTEGTDEYDLDELAETTPVPDVPIEQRILQAFPGSSFEE
ncbi:MAG: DNA polymerase III subunit gamma/tau [Acidimicrobiales bacterium]